jgi:prepilin-type N-terminal cleavage/methylation domain-containing protein
MLIGTRNIHHINKGFTLVELLIVVIILAILAAIVVPQFASTTDDAKVAALDSTLSNIRSAIDLYYQQHGDYPGKNTAVPSGGCVSATAGVGDASDAAKRATAFLEQLSMFTNSLGAACSKKSVTFKFGPYLKKNSLPENPVTSNAGFVVINDGNLVMAGDNVNLGWKYDVEVGKFIANDTSTDTGGTLKYDQH